MPEWFRMDVGIAHHPKTLRLRAALGCDLKAAVGVVTMLVAFAAEYAPDGVLSSDRTFGLAVRLDLPGLTDNEAVAALERAGFIKASPENGPASCPILHGFTERNGRQLYEAERKRNFRARRRIEQADRRARASGTRSQNVPGTNGTLSHTDGRTGRTDVTDGRKGQRRNETAAAGHDPGLEARFEPGALAEAARHFPERDVPLIAQKVALAHPGLGSLALTRRFWGWCSSARDRDTERRPGLDGAPADQSYDAASVLERAAALGDPTPRPETRT